MTSSGVLFWGQDAAGYGRSVTCPGEIVELAATDYQLYGRFRDGSVALVAGGWAYPEYQVPPEATNVWLRLTNVQTNHAGTYEVTVGSASWRDVKASATLQVGPAVPRLIEVPRDQSVRPGESVTFQCLARGTEPISYTWLRDGQAIEGATQPVLTLPFVTPRDGGHYAVFAQNGVGTSAWAFAFLQVVASGELLSPRLDAEGAFSVRLSVDPGRSYRVQTSPDLVNSGDRQSGAVLPSRLTMSGTNANVCRCAIT